MNSKDNDSVSHQFPIIDFGLKRSQFFWRTVHYRCGFEIPSFKKEYSLSNGLIVRNNSRTLKTKITKDKVVSFDTETYKGKCRLICLSEFDKGKNDFLMRNDKDSDIEFFEKILNFMMYKSSDTKFFRFFYNIDFDISSILKLWNNVESIDALKNGIEICFNDFRLKWLSGRLFILRKGKKSCFFTDLWNITKKSLQESINLLIDKNKGKDNIDGNLLNTSLDYWNDNLDDIIKYCIHDCELTSELGKHIIDSIIECGIQLPKYLVSSASLSKRDFRYTCYIPKIEFIPENIMEIAYNCYFGGRFEMLKSGFFEQLFLYDINSQYPTAIKDLPNLKYGAWRKYENLKQLPELRCFGYFYAKLQIPENLELSTIPIMYKQSIKFTTGYIEKWFTWYDLDLMREYITEIKECYLWIQDKNPKKRHRQYKPFKKRVKELYRLKAQYKREKNPIMYMLVKLTLNALYGCFIEQHKNYELDKSYTLTSGMLFNSVYASQITAFGRWSVIREIPRNLWKNIIAIHTDSIITDIPMNFLKCNERLGNWNLECKGKGIIMNTGVYQIGYIVKTRGISKKYLVKRKNMNSKFVKNNNWLRFCLQNKNLSQIEFPIIRMRKLKQAIIQDKSLDKVNTIVVDTRTIAVNSDKKRSWYEKFNSFQDLLDKNIDSLPLMSIIVNNEIDVFPNHLVY